MEVWQQQGAHHRPNKPRGPDGDPEDGAALDSYRVWIGTKLVERRECPARTYFARTLLHPGNLVALACVAMLCALVGAFGLLLCAVFVEGVVLAAVPRAEWFRRRVEADIAERQRRAGELGRALLVGRMSQMHRQELAEIETLVDRTRRTLAGRQLPELAYLGDGLGLEWLAERYVRLAIDHKNLYESLERTDVVSVRSSAAALDLEAQIGPEHIRSAVERRRAIAALRLDCLARAREHVASIEQELTAIFELVQLVHERSLAGYEELPPPEDVDLLLRGLENGVEVADDVAALEARSEE